MEPRTDDTKIMQALDAMNGSLALLVAHDLGLFTILSKSRLTLAQVARSLNIAERPTETLLCIAIAQGFVEQSSGTYSLTGTGRDYLSPDSPTYYGGMLDLRISATSLFGFESLKRAVLRDAPQAYGDGDAFQTHAADFSRAVAFTRAMHSRSAAAAQAWPGLVDLSGYREMLDVGGGSGAHSIGAALRWPALTATVFDIPPVCRVAEEYISACDLGARIRTRSGDMWRDPFPNADLHFYSNVYHDWPPDKCRLLTRRSFDALPQRGRLILHEILYNDDKSGPLEAALYSTTMLLWTEGRQYSGLELTGMLREAGFHDVATIHSFGLWSIVTGLKP